MSKIRALLTVLLMTCGLLLGSVTASAAEIPSPSLLAGDTAVRKGQEIEFTFSLDSYAGIKTGINALKGTLEYDPDVFEKPTQEDFELLNSWESIQFNPENGQFALIHRAGSKEAGEVFTLTLTANETLPAGETSVGISGLTVSEGEEDLSVDSVQVNISAVSEQSPVEQPDTGDGQTKPEASVGGEESPSQPENSQEPAGPETGELFPGTAVFSLCAAAAFLLVGVLVVFRKKKGRTGGVKMLSIAIAITAAAALTAGSVYALGSKGELNGDGNVDYTDVKLLQKHLIALELLPQDKWNAADLNADGKLTVTDLSLLVRKIEKTLDYQVQITFAMDRFYYEKREEVILTFSAKVSYGAEIEQVTIGGTEYAVQKTEDGLYTVHLTAADTPGVQKFTMTEVRLTTGRQVTVNYTEKIDVLKEVPAVEHFLAEERADTAQMKVSFTMKDMDSALRTSRMEVRKNTGDEYALVDTHKVLTGENEFLLDLEEGAAYTLHISAQYDRASNELEIQEDHSGSFAVMKEVQLNIDYQFTFGNINTSAEDGTNAGQFSKHQPVVLWFESGNTTKFTPERAVVNGESYPVQAAENDRYRVILPGFAQTGEAVITVEQVILENGKAFSLEKDNQIAVTILKELPLATGLSVSEDAAKGRFHVAFQLLDPDNSLSGHKILIQNAEGNTVGELAFGADDLLGNSMSAIVPLTDTGLTSAYTVQVVADCDLSADGSGMQRHKVLAQQTVKAQPRALVMSGQPGEPYGEKGGPVTLFYEISDNVEAALVKAVINHIELPASAETDGRWQVTATAPSKAGEQTFILSQLVFADGTIVNVNCDVMVEVMKSAPAVESYQTEDILEKDQMKFTFDLQDGDQSFLSGKVQLVERDSGAIVAEEAITQPETQVFTLAVEEQQEYTFRVLVSWKKTLDGSRQVADQILLEKTVYLVRDYGLRLSEIKTQSEQGVYTPYYEPDSTVKLIFRAETATTLQAEQAQVNGVLYRLTPVEKDVYSLTIKTGSQPGAETLAIQKIVLENGKELLVGKENSAQIEVLKTAPAVESFTSEKTAKDELKVQFVLSDPHGALQNAFVQIAEKDGAALLTAPVSPGNNEAAVPLTGQDNYVIKVTASFDRDTNALDDQSNHYTDEEIYTASVTASRDAIQFKDVTGVGLYRREGDNLQEITVLDVTGGFPSDLKNYYAVIQMEDIPDFYAGIKEFRRDAQSGRVYAVIDQEDVILYGENGERQNKYAFPLAYKDETGEHPLVKSAKELFDQMAAAPGGSYKLTEDLDASGLSPDAPAIAGTFTGELDGNGYKIINLPTSLFNTLSGANVHDLVIENARITTSKSGILANVIQNQSVIERVFIVDSSISNGVDELGAFAGNLRNATIRESASIDVTVKGLVAVGGIAGKISGGAVIENCYVTGKVQGTYDHPTLGARVGGIAGWHGGGSIRYCFTQVQVVAPAAKGNGGIIGGPNTGSPVLENCLSMSTGAGYRIAGFDVLTNAKNIYEYTGSGSMTNITEANREQIKETDAVFDKSFYRDTLSFDENLWELDLLVYGKRPNLKAAPGADNNFEIPGYTQVLKDENYRPEREQAYANMAKLMPFSDTRLWVEYANQLEDTDPLVQQAVAYVLPLDKNGSLVTGIHRGGLDRVQKIRLVFENDKRQDYIVSWQKNMGDIVAVYQVEGRALRYQFSRYIGVLDPALLEDIVSTVSAYDYAADIAALTTEEESRLYADYYNAQVKPGIRELTEKILLSQAEYPTYCESEVVQSLLRERISDGETWKKLLYGYNYYDKWYHLNYDGVILSDLLFFNGELLAEKMTAPVLTEKLLTAASDQRETHRTVVFYNNVLKNYTEEALMDFLGGLSYRIAGYDEPSDWFAGQFAGILKEQPASGGAEGIRYRIWDILSGLDDGRKSIILPILTAPQEDMYVISLPSQLMIGSLNRYPTYLIKDGGERERMQEIIDIYAEKMGTFYGVSSTWMSGAADRLNSFVNIQYDTRLNFPQSEAADAGDQDKNKTRDPVMKWVYEANNTISAKNGSAAFADGSNVYWVLEAALGTSDYIFFTFSHETAHNQDGRYFYGGAGRREGTGAEAHADGNIAQEMRDGCMVFNISKINDLGVEMTNNFSFERINSPEKIKDYYSKMFETGYVLDYLAAQAFLRLTPEQQAAVAVQAEHIPGGNASFSTAYKDVTVEQIKQMDLQDIEDLWKNKISIRNLKKGSTETVGTATSGSYGFESFYYMNWYQSHNDSGSPDTHSFKRLGMEMLGVGGYEGGYQIYMSALSENDLDALQKITGDKNITWKQYKQNRFKNVADNLSNIPYFDAETVIGQFKEAFERDAQNGTRSESIAVKRMLYGIVKRATGDFADGGIYQSPRAISVTSAEQLIRLAGENPYGYYRLDADLDFTGITAGGGSYIPSRFIGIIDGNGRQMTGMQYPLFGDLQYAQVKNLTIAAPVYAAGAQAVLAVKTRQAVVGDLTVTNINRPLPFVKTKTDGYYEYGSIMTTADNAG